MQVIEELADDAYYLKHALRRHDDSGKSRTVPYIYHNTARVILFCRYFQIHGAEQVIEGENFLHPLTGYGDEKAHSSFTGMTDQG